MLPFSEYYNKRYGSYKTAAGHRKDRDEYEDPDEVRQHNAEVSKRLDIEKRRKAARERMKARDIVPKKKGKPLYEKDGKITTHYKNGRLDYKSPIPNNPRADKLYGSDENDDSKLNVIYGSKDNKSKNLQSEDLNKFVSLFRRKYYSGKKKSFREFMSDIEDLCDTID